jgi:hypothetical protein
MKFEYKGKEYSFPAHLSDIKLGQRVSFFTLYGEELEQFKNNVQSATDPFEREMAITMFNTEMAVREFAHYTGIPLAEVLSEIEFNSLMNIYAVDAQLLHEQEQAIELQRAYEWNGETWVIEAPELSPGSAMTLNEFLHAKEAVRQIHKFGKGKWDSLPYLCAVYLRKEGEPFTEELVMENSERLKLMDELPLDIALAVAFFLSSTLNIYMTTLASSAAKEEVKESTQPATSTTGDGSVS